MPASADLMEGWEALEKATDAYVEALAYYKGTVAERFANARVRQLVEESGQSYRFRLAAIPVKVMAKRTRISNVTSDKDAVTKVLDHIREANKAAIYEPLIMKKCFTFGDSFVLVWPVEPDEDQAAADGDTTGAPADPEVLETGVELSYQSPLHCRVIYDGEDGRRDRFAIRRWREGQALGEGAKVWHVELWYHGRLERWMTLPGRKGGNAEDWVPYVLGGLDGDQPVVVDLEEAREPHDWGELPVKHFRTDLPYGEPAHFAAYGPQDAITKAITTQVVVDIEAHGWRERWRLLDDQRLLESGQEPVAWGDPADAPAADATQPASGSRRRGSGTEHTYAGTKAVGEYAAPDPAALIPAMTHWLQLMSVVTETPLEELDATVQLSGVSREKADAPLRDKVKEAKSYLEGTWADTYHLAARMAGVADPGAISIHWTPPEVTMDKDWWDTAGKRMEMGVPVAQILAEANYLPEQVKAWLDSQGEELALLQRVSILERIGAAAGELGVAVQTGVMDQATVAELMKRVVGEVRSAG